MTAEPRSLFHRMLTRRWPAVAFVLALTAGLSVFAAKVKPDYSIEMFFPTFDQRRTDYERYKKDFPFEDARAILVVEAPDLFTEAGIARIKAIEADFGKLEGVVDSQGLTTMTDVAGDELDMRMDKIVPDGPLDADALATIRTRATTDPLFRWTLAPPDGRATTIRVTLTREWASKEATRTKFLKAARKLIAKHDALAKAAGARQHITMNGLPVIRSEFTEMITKDTGLLFPLALVVVLLLLWVTFRRLSDIMAALVTILFAVVWTTGVMGIFGIPISVLTQGTPIIVMIISISDTVHIVSRYKELAAEAAARGDAGGARAAIAEACRESAIPCLLTEVTIAGGFLALLSADMVMIREFGIATAAGMLLAWLSNVTVLPLALSFFKRRGVESLAKDAKPSAAARVFGRFIGWVERVITKRPGRVVAVFALVCAAAATVGIVRVGRQYYSYDDLRPDSQLARNLRYVEASHGGTVPMAIHIEPTTRAEDAMHEPEALALVDRIEQRLEREFPAEVKNAGSIASYMRKAHAKLAGAELAAENPLPQTRKLIAQELLALDDPRALRDFLSSDHATASVFVMMPDSGSARATKIIGALERGFADEMKAHPSYRVTLTGIYGIADGIYRSLVGGLARSLAIAILVSFLIFCLVLRSWRLALIALIPNLLPLLFTFGIMGALGIDIKPSTVIIFSITLVIADDDTIQYLTRFRRLYKELQAKGELAADKLHEAAALGTLRETGLPMFVTSVAVTIGFLTLLFSQFLGLANFGLLIGVSLLSAVFADLFLSPLLLMRIRPKI